MFQGSCLYCPFLQTPRMGSTARPRTTWSGAKKVKSGAERGVNLRWRHLTRSRSRHGRPCSAAASGSEKKPPSRQLRTQPRQGATPLPGGGHTHPRLAHALRNPPDAGRRLPNRAPALPTEERACVSTEAAPPNARASPALPRASAGRGNANHAVAHRARLTSSPPAQRCFPPPPPPPPPTPPTPPAARSAAP